MIQIVKRADLSIEKYEKCLDVSSNSRLYARSFYLDIVADDWQCLVLDDYKAVMPLPSLKLKRHFYRNKIYQPPYCQQIGLYSKEELSSELIATIQQAFLKLKPQQLALDQMTAGFFEKNDLNTTERVNYILILNESYDLIKRNFSKGLKSKINAVKKMNLKTQEMEIEDFMSFRAENMRYEVSNKTTSTLKKLYEALQQKGMLKLTGVSFEGEIIGANAFVHHKNRIINLSSFASEKGYQLGSTTFILNEVIEKNAESDRILDFEGSMIPGVAKFYKSFGATIEPYYLFERK